MEQKKGSDKGIDGRLYFHDEGEGGKTKQVILSVKAGHANVAHLRDLRGVVDREKAEIGVLMTMAEAVRLYAVTFDCPHCGKTHPENCSTILLFDHSSHPTGIITVPTISHLDKL